jgi:DNA-binding protein HU-beta
MSETNEKKPREKKVKPGATDKYFKRGELAAAVADKTGLPRVKATAAVEAVFDTISERLGAGQDVRLVGFGAFVLADRKAGKGRDPRSGVEIDIPSSKSVRFRAGKSLRSSVGSKPSSTAE